MPNTTHGNTDIDNAVRAIESQTRHGDTEAAQTWRERLAELTAEAHEQAHRENERRWAAEQEKRIVAVESAEDAAVIAELAVRVVRYWRLSREAGQPVAFGKYSKLCTLAVEELEREYNYEVSGQSGGGWKLTPVEF